MKNHLRTILVCTLPALLVACGGGGGGATDIDSQASTMPQPRSDNSPPPAPVVPAPAASIDKYMGSWGLCKDGVLISVRAYFTLEKIADNKASIVEHHDVYEGTNTCSGTPARARTSRGTVTFMGSTQIGGDTAEKVYIETDLLVMDLETGKPTPAKYRWIYALKDDGKLYGGIVRTMPGSLYDAQGYPAAIGGDWVFNKE